MLGQLGDPLLSERHALLTFKIKRLSDHRNGEDPQILRHFRDYGRRAGTGTAAHACRDEHHVCAIKGCAQRFTVFISRVTADFRVRARAQTFGNTATDLDSLANRRLTQRLRVGIYREEFNTLNALAHHVFNGVTAAATDADDFNHRVVGQFHRFKHSFSPSCACRLRTLIVCVLLKN